MDLVFFVSCISGQMKACDSDAGTEILDIILARVFYCPIVHMISVLLLLNKFLQKYKLCSYHHGSKKEFFCSLDGMTYVLLGFVILFFHFLGLSRKLQ